MQSTAKKTLGNGCILCWLDGRAWVCVRVCVCTRVQKHAFTEGTEHVSALANTTTCSHHWHSHGYCSPRLGCSHNSLHMWVCKTERHYQRLSFSCPCANSVSGLFSLLFSLILYISSLSKINKTCKYWEASWVQQQHSMSSQSLLDTVVASTAGLDPLFIPPLLSLKAVSSFKALSCAQVNPSWSP